MSYKILPPFIFSKPVRYAILSPRTNVIDRLDCCCSLCLEFSKLISNHDKNANTLSDHVLHEILLNGI